MKYGRTLNLVFSAVLLFLLVSAVAAFAFTEVQVNSDTSPGSWQTNPAIDGNRIIWQDWRNWWHVYMRDLTTGKETRIGTSSYQFTPDISGSKIVWIDWRHGGSRDKGSVYLYDLDTSSERRVSASTSHYSPVVSENRIAWLDAHENTSDIYVCDTDTGLETQIPAGPGFKSDLDLSGDKIIWRGYSTYPQRSSIYLYDLSTSTEQRISANTSQFSPTISGNTVAWADFRNGNYDIYAYDISMGKETQITTDPSWQWSPAIFGNTIVWEDLRSHEGNILAGDIYMCDILSGNESQVTSSSYWEGVPAIFEDRIVWQDNRKGNFDIYTTDVGTVLSGDTNYSGNVDIFDLVVVAKAFGSTPTSPNWDPRADLNGDNKIDIFDLVVVAKNFGKVA